MGTPNQRTAYEELARSFEASAVFGHIHSYDLYRNWLEAVWAFLDAPCNPEAYKECLDKYTFEQGGEFGRLLGVYTTAVEHEPFLDILGELFMRLDVNSVRSGQFMTPFCIAEMMAQMQFSREDFERHVAEKGEVTVCDPAVGSGVMLLAFSKVVNDAFGRWGVDKLRLYGQDIDRRCVLMCRIQLRMNGLDSFGRLAGRLVGGVPETADNRDRKEDSTPEARLLAPAARSMNRTQAEAGRAATGLELMDQKEHETTVDRPDPEDAIVLQSGNTQGTGLVEQLTLF